MKTRQSLIASFALAICCLLLSSANPVIAQDESTDDKASSSKVYELRIYTCEPGKLAALHERFENHTIDIFAKHGMRSVAYWTPADGEDKDTKLIYIIEHQSRDAAKESWKAFIADPEWQKVAKDSKDAHGKILAKAPESVYMELTDYSPLLPEQVSKP